MKKLLPIATSVWIICMLIISTGLQAQGIQVSPAHEGTPINGLVSPSQEMPVFSNPTGLTPASTSSQSSYQGMKTAVYEPSGLCSTDVPFLVVDLSAAPAGTYTLTDAIRNGTCCGVNDGAVRCFEVLLIVSDETAAVSLDVLGATATGAADWWLTPLPASDGTCTSPSYKVGDEVCIQDGGLYALTFCKPGQNIYELQIEAIAKPSIPEVFEVRQDCSSLLQVSGYDASSLSWSGEFADALDFSTGNDSPTFTWIEGMPLYPNAIDFSVCGTATGLENCSGYIEEICETTSVFVYPELQVGVSPEVPLFCEDGQVELMAGISGGKPPYSVQWINPLGEIAGNGETILADVTGTWTLVVADALTNANCQAAEIEIEVIQTILSLEGNVENVACFGGNDGSIEATVEGGTAPYQFHWSHDASLNGPIAQGLEAGTYILTVADSNECTVTMTFTVEQAAADLLAQIVQIEDESCLGANNGTAAINTLGGTPPYTLLLTDPNGQEVIADGFGGVKSTSTSRMRHNEISRSRNTPSQEDLLNVLEQVEADYFFSNLMPGTYQVSLTDANGCETQISFTLAEGPASEVVITPDGETEFCAGGWITLSATEGLSYLWNTGETTQSIAVDETGEYTVQVTFGNNCIGEAAIMVVVNAMPEVSLSAFEPVCSNTAAFSLGGGIPEGGIYSGEGVYEGIFDPSLLLPGTYEISYIYADPNGCSAAATQSIEVLQAPCIEVSHTDVSCFGGHDGSITVNITCGNVIQICIITSLDDLEECLDKSKIGGAQYNNLPAGTYFIVAEDANGCYSIEEVTINEPSHLVAEAGNYEEMICQDGVTSVIITAEGGTPPYTGTGTFTVGTGEHTFVVSDANDCLAEVSIEIEAAPLVAFVCPEDIQITTLDNTFILDGGLPEGGIYSGNGITFDEATGDYLFDPALAGTGEHNIQYYYEDEYGCSYSCEFMIVVVFDPDFECPEDLVLCEDHEAIELVISGHEGQFSGTGVVDNVFDPQMAGPGEHQIVFTYSDAFENEYSCNFLITVNALPEVSFAELVDVCEHGPAFTLEGGFPEGGVYSGPGVVNGIFDPTIVGAGTYELTYTYTDANGCSNSALSSIYVKTMYAFYEIEDVSCNGGSDGAIYLEVHNGNGTYYFLWSNGATTQNLENVPAGEYSVEIYDGINCTLYVTNMIVDEASEIVIAGEVEQISAFGENDGSIITGVSGGNPPYSYAWSNGETTADLYDLAPGTYTLTVTDANDCQATAEFVIEEPENILDLQVTIEVNIATPDPDEVDELIFAVVVTNLNQTIDATGVSVENIPPDVFPYITRVDDGTHGTYDPVTGVWTIGTIPAGGYALLVYSTGMLLSEDIPSAINAAEILPFDQTETNLANNYDEVVVTIGESTGGDDGGIESDGNMASQIALRHHKRLFESRHIALEDRLKEMSAFEIRDMLTGAINTATLDGTPATGISYFIPEKGPAETHAYISTPADLLAITNAKEIFAVDYLQENNSRRAAILAIATNPGVVYDHTKVICDRLTGASLEEIRHIQIADQPFILSKLVHPNGYVDYAVSFIATWRNNGFTIDNRWHNELYNPNGTEEVFNFQVWSVTPQFTRELVEDILESMSSTGDLTFRNATVEPEIPLVYVKNGSYRNGKLMLNLVNTNGASSITVYGTKAVVENGNREGFQIEVSIPSSGTSSVEIPVGYLFDAGFSIANNKDNTRDVLYYADGPWMFDYDPGNSMVSHFSTEAENGVLHDRSYNIERNASIKGSVRTYASLFRRLGPGTMPMDMTQFEQVVFNAHGVGTVEVMIAKASIHAWNEQYRTVITLNPNDQEYRINFSDLKTAEGQTGFTADDIISVIFNPIGNGSQASPFEVNISNLHFINHLIEENEAGIFYTSYPNPFKNTTTLDFVLKNENKVKVEILNLYGQVLEVLNDGYLHAGTHRVEWTPKGLKNGIYIFRITIGNETYSGKMIYQP